MSALAASCVVPALIAGTEFSDQFREGFWAASIRDDGRYTRLCKCPRQVRSERACADDADAHGFFLSVSLS